jgi:hypothetical protein
VAAAQRALDRERLPRQRGADPPGGTNLPEDGGVAAGQGSVGPQRVAGEDVTGDTQVVPLRSVTAKNAATRPSAITARITWGQTVRAARRR